ncbi:hypothetical protein CRUP_017238, partial [Coryphaenoides rupestris]
MSKTYELIKPYLERPECQAFITANMETLKQVLLDTLKNASSPAKRVIVCTKETSVGARKSAYALLVEIGKAFERFYAMEQYLVLVYAGLLGSVTMINCTVLALTRLVFEYKDAIAVTTMEQLLHNVCLLLTSHTREIVKAALGFIKVLLFVMDPKTLASHVTVILEGIGNLNDVMKRHFRT